MLKVSILTGVVGGLLLLLLITGLPIRATDSDNTSLTDLIPDLQKIYREALVTPHQEAAKQIQDPEIARYYNLLLHKVGFDAPLDEQN